MTEVRELLDLSEASFEETKAAVLSAKVGTAIRTNPYDAPLIVNMRSFGRYYEHGFSDEAAFERAVVTNEVAAHHVVLTEDGRPSNSKVWHEGESNIDTWVAYARWTPEGQVAHGFIDPVSRALVQSG